MAFPAVEVDTANNATGGAATNGDTAATSHSVVMPTGISPGSQLIVFGRTTGTGTVAFPAGWTLTQSATDASDDMAFWAYKNELATGNEDGTSITVTHTNSNKMVAAVLSISGAANPAVRPPQSSTIAIGTGSTVSPTTCTPTGGAKDYLWIAMGSADGEHNAPPTTIPTNYGASSGWSTGTTGAVGLNATLFTATRNLNAASEDAGNWTTSVAVANGWTSWLIAVHPATNLFPAAQARTRAQGTFVLPPRPNGQAHTRAQGSPTAARAHRTSALGTPTVGAATGASPASRTRTRAQGTPVVKPTVLPAALARTRAQGAFSILLFTVPASLVRTRAQGAPTVNPTINLQSAGIVRARGQGFVTVNLDYTLTPASQVRTRAQGDIHTSPAASPASLTRTRAQGSPAARQVHRYRALGSPVAIFGIAPASLTRDTLIWGEGEWGEGQWGEGRTLGSPHVNPQVRPAAQAHTRAQGTIVVTNITGGASPASLTRTRALGSPHVKPTLAPAALARTRALGATSAQRGHRFRSLGSLAVTVVSATLSALVRTRAQGSPVVIAANPSPASLTRTRVQGTTLIFAGHRSRHLGSPIVAGSIISPASVTHTRAQGSPSVSTTLGTTVTVESLLHTRGVSTPGILFGHRVRALGALDVGNLLDADILVSGLTSTGSVPFLMGMPNRQRLVGDPAAAVSNPGEVDPASLARTRALGSPQVEADVTVSPASVTRTRALGTTGIAGAGHRSSTLGSVTVTVTALSVRPSGLTSDHFTIPLLLGGPDRQRTLGTPTAQQVTAGAPGALTHTRALGSPNLSTGPISLTHTRALGDPRTNVTISPAGLAHTRFASGATLLGPGVSVGNYNKMWMGIGL